MNYKALVALSICSFALGTVGTTLSAYTLAKDNDLVSEEPTSEIYKKAKAQIKIEQGINPEYVVSFIQEYPVFTITSKSIECSTCKSEAEKNNTTPVYNLNVYCFLFLRTNSGAYSDTYRVSVCECASHKEIIQIKCSVNS